MKVQYLALIGCAIALSLVNGVVRSATSASAGQSQILAQANPCAPNPCASPNPCAAKSANPCAANPCASNPCAAAAAETADVKAVANPCASYKLAVEVVDGKNIINLTQTPCQFLESEGVNLNFQSNSAADCNRFLKGMCRLPVAKQRSCTERGKAAWVSNFERLCRPIETWKRPEPPLNRMDASHISRLTHSEGV